MIIKANNTPSFSISLNLSVNCEAEALDLTVTAWDKKNETVEKKQFAADSFPAALAYFREKEAEWVEREESADE